MADCSDEQARIYLERAAEYDELVRHEDVDGQLLREIQRHAPLQGARLVDIGAGTGRISRLLAPLVGELTLVERAPPMLALARRHLDRSGVRYRAIEADARALPLADASVDVAIAGWVFGHFRHWMPDGWRDEVGRAVAEMERVTARGGFSILIETLGTGVESPRAHPALDEYFDHLEGHLGFTRYAIRTDYCFQDVAHAARVLESFFGPALGALVRARGSARVPECTAVFVKPATAPR